MAPPADPLNFVPAEDFFGAVSKFHGPQKVVSVESTDSTDKTAPLRFAAHVTLGATSGHSNTHVLVQFVTPQIFRIRYNPKVDDVNKYPDSNTRTIVQNSFADLVDQLQEEARDSGAWNAYPGDPSWYWKTSFEEKAAGHWVLSSVDYKGQAAQGVPNTRVHILDAPFRIVATRVLEPKSADPITSAAVGLSSASTEQVIWQTSPQTFAYNGNDAIDVINEVVLSLKKPGPAEYLGFGEQGGRTVLKKPTYMNYFCYDNFNYKKVYGQGALDTREPLYHSTPFYLEMNALPGYRSVTGLMVDNYSQVSMDLGKANSGTIRVGTRFGTFDAYILTADDVPKMIWQYTSLVGRPKLKPRFVLGHHQGCYGYSSNEDVKYIVDSYRKSGIPLDGMHLDVDFQDRYRTFTNGGVHFPNPKGLFTDLRNQGVKCCTNITPILTLRESDSDQYKALRAFWNMNNKLDEASNFLVPDHRYKKGQLSGDYPPDCTRYDGGYISPSTKNPNDLSQRTSYADYIGGPIFRDDYALYNPDSKVEQNYNTGFPFHGGVSYGENLGTPGYYPDLNRAVTRKVWGEQYQYLFDQGLEFVWQDMTTPAVANTYGDMLGFPSRLLMSDDTYGQDPKKRPPTKTAIELWSLYSYNLHKATYHGLNKLKGRENKRNFIIGRGSQTGMHRYAGLWTGDNGSSWDFWRISVSQVLALGYSGLTIAGVDMGGFTYDPDRDYLKPPHWCDPELLVRWYTGAFLLPWYRNHYNRHFDTKVFQEPFEYTSAPEKYSATLPELYWLYRSVEPICRYYVQLRYTLMQVLYDTMFANLINGLPIARAMLITDPDDTSLFNEGADFLDNQYLLGYQLLVCPILDPGVQYRDVYLPQGDLWFPSNLRVNVDGYGPDPLQHAASLSDAVEGGTVVNYFCPIPDASYDKARLPFVTPMYVRGGSIVPQLDVRPSINENDLNPPCLHVYPGNKDTSYTMYLDDGVSRDSAPADLPQYKYAHTHHLNDESTDDGHPHEAQSKYREVLITQSYSAGRTVTLSHPWNNYDPTPNVGTSYKVAVWSAKSGAPTDSSKVSWQFVDQDGKAVQDAGLKGNYDTVRGVLSLEVPCGLVPSLKTPDGGVGAGKWLGIKVQGLN